VAAARERLGLLKRTGVDTILDMTVPASDAIRRH
jgi:hypothetical protein